MACFLLDSQLLEEKLRKIESGELPPTHLPDGTLIDENNKWNETTFAYFETYIKHEGMEAPLTHYDSWVKETYGRTKWEGFVKTSGEVTMGFTKGLLTGIIEGIVDTAGFAYQLVVDPQQVGEDMLYAAEYLIQNPDMVIEAAKQMYANFESASPEEKAEMIGKVSSILVPGMGVTKAGKAAKVPEALSSMTQAVKTSKVMNVLANPVKKFKAFDWKSYTIRFQDWVQSLKPGRFAVTPEGMLIRMPDEKSSVVRRIDAGDGKKIEGMSKANLDKIRETAPDYYKELIDKHGDKGRYYARSPEEYESLAKDPAKNFKINEKSKIERLAGLELEARGDLPGPVVRDTNPAGAEFIDATGVKWDVKGWYSKFAPKGYTLEKAIADIEESLSKGENVIIDSSKMFPEHITEVRKAVKELGLSEKLLWWP
ncbi:hypothetical protein [Paenibacillus aquistagni]|uniref:hypothetical protein n=1 Tax=Paenibacillus aquistagni TaxID=1852522 RepID=UPI00111C1F05|nr:hypothetical protein [Paenibacillus aquistagni]